MTEFLNFKLSPEQRAAIEAKAGKNLSAYIFAAALEKPVVAKHKSLAAEKYTQQAMVLALAALRLRVVRRYIRRRKSGLAVRPEIVVRELVKIRVLLKTYDQQSQ